MSFFSLSQISRLVYGFLLSEGCDQVAELYISVSPHLTECLRRKRQNSPFKKTVNGFSLRDILHDYALLFDKYGDHARRCHLPLVRKKYGNRNNIRSNGGKKTVQKVDAQSKRQELSPIRYNVTPTEDNSASESVSNDVFQLDILQDSNTSNNNNNNMNNSNNNINDNVNPNSGFNYNSMSPPTDDNNSKQAGTHYDVLNWSNRWLTNEELLAELGGEKCLNLKCTKHTILFQTISRNDSYDKNGNLLLLSKHLNVKSHSPVDKKKSPFNNDKRCKSIDGSMHSFSLGTQFRNSSDQNCSSPNSALRFDNEEDIYFRSPRNVSQERYQTNKKRQSANYYGCADGREKDGQLKNDEQRHVRQDNKSQRCDSRNGERKNCCNKFVDAVDRKFTDKNRRHYEFEKRDGWRFRPYNHSRVRFRSRSRSYDRFSSKFRRH